MLDILSTIGGWFSGIGTEIRAVLLTLFVTIVWTEYREWHKIRAERRRIASMVVAEVLNQGAFIIHVGSIANYLVAQNTWTTRTDLVRLMPPRPLVFTAMVDRLPVLGAALSGNVVAFYDTLDRARTFVATLPKDIANDPMAHVRFSELALAMQMASEIGQKIIQDLKAFSEPVKSKMHDTIIAEMVSRLHAVRNGGSPNVAPEIKVAP